MRWWLLLVFVSPGAAAATPTSQPVKILTDTWGVPHLFGSTQQALFYGLGYVTARDRLEQLEEIRYGLTGQMAALKGPGALEPDFSVRRDHGGLWLAEGLYPKLGQRYRLLVEAYVGGINAFLKEPAAAARLKRTPEPWRPAVVLAIALNRQCNHSVEPEIRRVQVELRLAARFGKGKAARMVEDLFFLSPAEAPTTILAPARRTASHATPGLSACNLYCPALSSLLLSERQQQRRYEELGVRFGSSGAVVGGQRTATGVPLLISHPSLGQKLPPALYEVHLTGGGLDVAGVTMPGIPAVLVGFNRDIAWGQTDGSADQLDVFVERTKPDDPFRYWHKNRWRPMTWREEVLAVKGRRPVHRRVYATVHGPVLAWDAPTCRAWSRADTDYTSVDTLEAMLDIMTATDWRSFYRATEKSARPQNYLYLDRTGNIGYRMTGRVPKRREGDDGRRPRPGTGEWDWRGTLPAGSYPSILNPTNGLVASANNKPSSHWTSCDFQPGWGPISPRIAAINRALSSLGGLTVDSFESLNRNEKLFSGLRQNETARQLLPLMLPALTDLVEPDLVSAAETLTQWDLGHMTRPAFPAMTTSLQGEDQLFDRWADNCLRLTFRDEFAEAAQYSTEEHLYRALTGRMSRDCFDNLTTPQRETKKEVLQSSFRLAFQSLRAERRSPRVSNWHQPCPGWGGRPGIPPYSAGANTYRMIVRFGPEGPSGLSILVGGNCCSGPHATDQLAPYVRFQHKPMWHSEAEAREHLGDETKLMCP